MSSEDLKTDGIVIRKRRNNNIRNVAQCIHQSTPNMKLKIRDTSRLTGSKSGSQTLPGETGMISNANIVFYPQMMSMLVIIIVVKSFCLVGIPSHNLTPRMHTREPFKRQS